MESFLNSTSAVITILTALITLTVTAVVAGVKHAAALQTLMDRQEANNTLQRQANKEIISLITQSNERMVTLVTDATAKIIAEGNQDHERIGTALTKTVVLLEIMANQQGSARKIT